MLKLFLIIDISYLKSEWVGMEHINGQYFVTVVNATIPYEWIEVMLRVWYNTTRVVTKLVCPCACPFFCEWPAISGPTRTVLTVQVSLSSLGHCLNRRYKNGVLLLFTALPSMNIDETHRVMLKNWAQIRRCQCVVHSYTKQRYKDGELKFLHNKKVRIWNRESGYVNSALFSVG